MIAGMLRTVYTEVKKNYYDAKLHGMDWDGNYKQYTAMIGKARNQGEGLRIVAAFLAGLNDAHTFFTPPERDSRYIPGYRFAIVGDACFITQVRPGSDAASKLHIGDQVAMLDGFNVNRDDFHDLRYFLDVMALRPSQNFKLRSPQGEEREAVVNSQVTTTKAETVLANTVDYIDILRRNENQDHAWRSQIVENGDAAFWKWESFNLRAQEIEKAISAASKHKTLVLDLRGNAGGSTETLERLAGALFDHDVKICDRMGRKEGKPIIAQRRGQAFDGKLIVLVDSATASEAELLARVVQLEHRGTVIGDRTAASVMEARYFKEAQGVEPIINFGINVTDADLIMSDGKSLEKTGVTPDQLLLPTAADLAAGRDPVLARAAELAGVKVDPAEAGQMFPFEWQPLR